MHAMIENPPDDHFAFGRLFPEVYNQLKELAHRQLYREHNADTLNTTALVHEVYLKMTPQNKDGYANKSQFFALAAQSMRRILIDHARKKKSEKRGGDRLRITFGKQDLALETTADEILTLHEALERFSELSERRAQVVEYSFFGGFNHEEIAALLDVSVPTVRRDWRLARAWLSRELKREILNHDN